MTKYIKNKDGKFAGSIGDGKTKTPSAAPTVDHYLYENAATDEEQFASVRPYTRPILRSIHDVNEFPTTSTIAQQIGTPTILSVSGGRIAASSETTVVMPVDKSVTVEVEYDRGADTYTVRRLEPIMRGKVSMTNPDAELPPGFIILGEQTDVHFPELSERVYWAGMYHNGSFPDEV